MKRSLKTYTCEEVKRRKARLQEIRESNADYQTKLIQAYGTLEYLIGDLSRAVPAYLREDIQACLDLNTDIWTGKAQKNTRSESLPTANER